MNDAVRPFRCQLARSANSPVRSSPRSSPFPLASSLSMALAWCWTALLTTLFASTSVTPLVVTIAALLTGCGVHSVTTVAPQAAQLQVAAVVVYPFQVKLRSAPALTYQKTVDLVDAALAPRRFQVYSYGDLQLFPLDSLDAYEGQSLLALVAKEGLELNRLALLKGAVMLETAEGESGSSPAQEGHLQGEVLNVRARVELFHYGEQAPIVSSEARFSLDPLEATPIDPFPTLTREVRRLAASVMETALKHVKAPAAHERLPIDGYADHALLFRVASDDHPSIARRLLALDEVDQASTLLQGYQYFYPDISLLQVQALHQTPGLLVTGLSAPWLEAQGLRVGDHLIRVNGLRIEAPHQLDRQAMRAGMEPLRGEPLKVEVLRKGETVMIELRHP